MATRCGPAMLAFVQWEQLFKALGDAQRLTLLGRLATASGPLTVTEASECCGIHLSGVSRHLQILKQAGVVSAEKRGREVVYRVGEVELASKLRAVADALERCCVAETTSTRQRRRASDTIASPVAASAAKSNSLGPQGAPARRRR